MSFMSEAPGVKSLILYMKEKKSLWLIILLLALGIALMLFGGSDSVGESESSLEARVERLCSRVDGASEISVMVRTDSLGEVRGIAVVCKGGNSAGVKLTITEMLTSLFGSPASAVSVVGGK